MKRQWKIKSFLVLAALLTVSFGNLFFAQIATAVNPTTMSFQGKVVNANGTNVTDGTYSFLFKLYTVSSGGSTIWTETQSSVTVTAGVFQVNLGSVCPFFTADSCNSSTPIDFNANPNLYLGITFNSDPAGEMTPRVQLQSVPFAYNADKVGGLSVSQLVQLSPGSQQTGFINVSGASTFGSTINGLTLASAADGFTLAGGTTPRTLTVTGADITIGNVIKPTSAGSLSLQANGSNALNLTGAAASTWSIGATNALTLTSSNLQVAAAGTVSVLGGQSPDFTNLTAGAALSFKPSILTTAGGTGGAININGGEESGSTGSTAGAVNITGGANTGASGNRTGGAVVILGGDATNGGGSTRTGGSVRIDAGASNTNGSITIGNANAAAITLGRTGITTTSNGNLTLAANQTLTLNAGTGTIVQTYTTGAAGVAASASSHTLNNTNTGAGITLQGDTFTPANVTTASSGGNTINGVNFAAGTLSGVNNVTNGINFASATGYTNFINTPTFVLSSAGAISGLTAVTSSGTITFSGLNTAGVVHNSSSGVLSTGDVVLSSETSGNFVATLGTLTGLTTTGNTGEASTPTLSVTYGSGANTAVQGNVTFTCTSGSGNLTGGGTVITEGTGGTCAALSTNAAVSFGTSVTTPLVTSSAGLAITGGTTLALSSTGANTVTLDTGGAAGITIAGANANAVTIGNTTSNPNIAFSGSGTFGTTTGTVSLNGNTTVAGSKTFTVGTGLTTLGGGLTVTGSISATTTITGTTLNGTTGINTGASAGTQRIDSSGNLVNIGNLTAAGNLTVTNTGSGNDIAITSQDAITLTTGANALTISTNGATAPTAVNITDGTNTLAKIIDGNVSSVNYGLLQLGAKASTGNEAAQCAASGDVGKIYVNSTDKAVFACTAANAWEQLDNSRVNQVANTGSYTVTTTDAIVGGNDSLTITPSTANSDILITYSSNMSFSCTGLGCNPGTVTIRLVRGTTCAGGTLVATFTNTDPTSATTKAVTYSVIDTSPTNGSSNTYIACAQRSGGSGTITDTMTNRYLILKEVDTTGADYAETYYSRSGDIAPGTVVAVDPAIKAGVQLSTGRYQKGLIGVVSTQPGQVLSDHTDSGTPVIVGLAGRVPVKVSAENGPIHNGDSLTSSSTPGVAMKATKAGTIIGTALTEYAGEGIGEVMLFVSTGQTAGTLPLTVDNSQPDSKQLLADLVAGRAEAAKAVDLSSIFTDRLAAAVEIVTPKVVSDTVQTNTIVIGDQGIHFTNEKGEIVASIDASGTFHGNTVSSPLVSIGDALSIDNPLPSASVAAPTPSGDITATSNTPGKSDTFQLVNAAGQTVANIDKAGNASFNGGLNLASASLSGGLNVGGDANFAGLSTFQKLATFLGRTIFRQDVQFDGHLTVAGDGAGYASLRAGENKVHVTFVDPYTATPIVSVAAVDGQFVSYALDNVKADSFDIILKDPATENLTFSWTAIGVNSPRTATNLLPATP